MSGEALSTKDIARQLGCSTSWVCQLIRSGKLPARRFGYSWMVDRGDFRRYVERNNVEVKQEKK